MDIGKIAALIAIYLTIGLLVWLDVKTKDDIALKMTGKSRYKKPYILKVVFLWFPLYIINLVKSIVNFIKTHWQKS